MRSRLQTVATSGSGVIARPVVDHEPGFDANATVLYAASGCAGSVHVPNAVRLPVPGSLHVGMLELVAELIGYVGVAADALFAVRTPKPSNERLAALSAEIPLTQLRLTMDVSSVTGLVPSGPTESPDHGGRRGVRRETLL